MALAKVAIVLGAGLIGTALTRDGNLLDVTRLFSGAFRIATKQLKKDKESNQSSGKTQSAYLLAQVNTLREELQFLASSRPITIVTGAGSGLYQSPSHPIRVQYHYAGSGKYCLTAVIIVGTLGYVYIWWKGWKIPDMMFVTRRAFSDVCNQVGKKADLLYSSITVADQQLSSTIDQVDSTLAECTELSVATRCDVSHLHGDVNAVCTDVESVYHAMKTLETRIVQIEGTQDYTSKGIYHLCRVVDKMEHARKKQLIQDSLSSSQHAIELPQASPIVSRAFSLPPLSIESASTSHSSSVASPSSSASPASSHESRRVLRSSISLSAYGLKELEGIANPTKSEILKSNMISESTPNRTTESTSSSTVSNETAKPNCSTPNISTESTTNTAASSNEATEFANSTASTSRISHGSSWSTWKFPRVGIFSRSHSAATP